MRDERLAHVHAIFDRLVDLDPAAQAPALDVECHGDATLRTEIESLLAAAALETTARLRSPVAREASAFECTDEDSFRMGGVPPTIGGYRIVRLIGTGGMGEVYEATQENPSRSVALKVIRTTNVSADGRRRFAREAEALGRLRHPGIAHIYEAAVDERADATGHTRPLPYLAMELVCGSPIVGAARAAQLDTSARLELMAMVCDAVQHAHAQGVVHRDLKPGNILLDDHGWPKVIDFGVARLLDTEHPNSTLRTKTGQLVGTLAYMSPEQISGRLGAVDARADVYALGAVLFELLVDTMPIDVRGRSIADAARLIQESEPRRLSSIDHRLRGDLDVIVATALAKEPAQRYPSAAALAADLRRVLRDESIQARRPGPIERTRRFTRRHRALVATTIGVGLALVVGLVATTTMAVRESMQRRSTEREAYRAQIAEATAAIELLDVATARRALDHAPPHLRGWEWNQLVARLDESEIAIDLGAVPIYGARFTADGRALIVPQGRPIDPPRVIPLDRDRAPEVDGGEATVAWFRANRRADPWLRRVSTSAPIEVLGMPPESGLANAEAIPPDVWSGAVDGRLHAATMSADGRTLAGLTLTSPLKLVVTSTRPPHRTSITDVWTGGGVLRLDPTGAYGLLATDRRENTIWRLDSPSRVATLEGHEDRVIDAVFSPDLEFVYTASWDNTVRRWRRATGEPMAVGAGHRDSVLAVSTCDDGVRIATGSRDGTVRLWDAETLRPLGTWLGHERAVFDLAFSPDGQRIVSTSIDGTCRVWRTDRAGDRRVLRGHTSYVYPIAFDPGGARIASGSWDHTVRIWDVAARSETTDLVGHDTPVVRLAWSDDGTRLASRDMDGHLRIWDVLSGTPIGAHMVEAPKSAPLGWIGDGEIACGFVDGEIHSAIVVDVDNGSTRRIESDDGDPIVADPRRPTYVRPGVRIERPEPSRLRIVDQRNERTLAELDGHTEEIFCWAVTPDGARLFTAGRDRTIRVWELSTFTEIARLRGHRGHVWQLAIGADGHTLASSSGDYTVRLWSAPPMVQHAPVSR